MLQLRIDYLLKQRIIVMRMIMWMSRSRSFFHIIVVAALIVVHKAGVNGTNTLDSESYGNEK